MIPILFACVACAAPVLTSGEAIPVGVADLRGPLAADKLFNHPVGAAHALGNAEPDLFVIAGSRFYPDLVVLPSAGRSRDGVPVFGSAQIVRTPEFMNYATPGAIFERAGKVNALWVDKTDLVHLAFDRDALGFNEVNRIPMPTLPRAPSCIGWLPDRDGEGFTLLMSIADSVRETPILPEGINSRSKEYDPYDGAGVWRGGFSYATLYSARFQSLLSGPAGEAKRTATTEREVRRTYERLACVDLGDGRERDVIGGSVFGPIYYYHATGGGFDAQHMIAGESGIALRHPTIGAGPTAYPATNGRWSDLLVGGEGGIYYYRFLERFTDTGQPIYADPVYALQDQAKLFAGTLPVLSVVDWNGDGALDIVAGNSEGNILFFRNGGSNASPAFAPGEALKAGGELIHIQAGYSGSIQGPGEARWGYVCPTVVDWSGDGVLDIVSSSVTGHHLVYVNEGTPKEPLLASAHPIYLDGLELHGTWRCQPGVAMIGDRTAYVALDDEDQFHLFWRLDAYNVTDGGKLMLESGDPIGANYLNAGGTGRIKIVLYDWDGDGQIDILVGTPRHASIPDPENGLPQSLGKPGSAVMLLRNVGSDSELRFARPEVLHFRDNPIYFGQHACSPAVAPFGKNEKPGLVVGIETGRILYFERGDIGFAAPQ